MTITDEIRLEILNKLRNKDKLEEKEIEFIAVKKFIKNLSG